MNLFDIACRFPRHHWVRVFANWREPSFEPGHGWMYFGAIRRDAWVAGPFQFGVMRMPRTGEATG